MLIKNNDEPLKPSCTSGLYIQRRKRTFWSFISLKRQHRINKWYNHYLDNYYWYIGGFWCAGMLAAVILNAINVIATMLQVTGR